jgi:6-phosphogluconolactonase
MGAGGKLNALGLSSNQQKGERNNSFERINESHADDTVFIVGGYTRCELLAHTPKDESKIHGDDDDEENASFSVEERKASKKEENEEMKSKAGVHVLSLDGRTGQLEMVTTNDIGPNVAFVTRHPTKPDVIYASTERIDVEGEVVTMRLTRDLRLKEIARCSAGGKSTCYLNFNKSNRYMMSVNYWDAKLALIHLDDLGRPETPNTVFMQPGAKYVDDKKPTREEHWEFRQRWPHSHCIVTEPYHNMLHFVVDLGLDRIFVYRVGEPSTMVTAPEFVCKASVKLQPGKGPRHLVFHQTLKTAYLVNELDSTVSVFNVNVNDEWMEQLPLANEQPTMKTFDDEKDTKEESDETAALNVFQCISTLPEGSREQKVFTDRGVWKAASHASEIRVHPSGKFLYVGNRGHDSIACFKIDAEDGSLEFIAAVPSGGKCPRNFHFSANGGFVCVGNQNSSNVASFAVCPESGMLELVHVRHSVCLPNYVYPIPKSTLDLVTSSDDDEDVVL